MKDYSWFCEVCQTKHINYITQQLDLTNLLKNGRDW